MQYKVDVCSDCKKTLPIVNVKYGLCNTCNKNRLGKSPKQYSLQVSHSPSQVSKKQSVSNRLMKEMKDNITQQAIDEGEYYCRGCGCSGMNLDRSHNISIKQNKSLEHDPNNITLLCRSCHQKWESGNYLQMSSLLCFNDIMKYIFNVDRSVFWKIENKKIIN